MLCLLRNKGVLLTSNLSVTYHINQRHFQDRQINYYDVLGVKRHSDIKEVKIAYFKMAKRFHPDFNKTLDSKQMFELIAEAYEVLSDEERRAEYDETGCVSSRHGGRSAKGPARQSTDSSYTAEQMYSKIFNSKEKFEEQQEYVNQDFANSSRSGNVTREYIKNISFEESICGLRTQINVLFSAYCNKCQGSRSELGFQEKICPYCEGTGEETVKTGHIVGRKECSYCHGTKLFNKFKCLECEGIGRKLYDQPYPIIIPPGTEHGQVIRYELDPDELGLSSADREKEKVVYVTVNVNESPFFTRNGMDLDSYMGLTPGISLLGGKIDYEGLTKTCELNIQPCTSSHQTVIVHMGGVYSPVEAGDHYLTSLIKVPKKLTWRQRRTFMKFAALENDYLGTIDGVLTDHGHRFEHNIVNATKIRNTLVNKCLFNQEDLSWTQRTLKFIEQIKKIFFRITDASFYQQEKSEEKEKDESRSNSDRSENRQYGI